MLLQPNGVIKEIFVSIPREKFLEEVKRNRTKYQDTYDILINTVAEDNRKAFAEFQTEVANADCLEVFSFRPSAAPHNNTDKYDRIIRMAELSIAETIDLTENEFDQYIMNNWQFMNEFKKSLMSYATTTNLVASL